MDGAAGTNTDQLPGSGRHACASEIPFLEQEGGLAVVSLAGKQSACSARPLSRLSRRIPMSNTSAVQFDFRKRVAYDAAAKRCFHREARRRLLDLAAALGLEPDEYDLRRNEAGIAVSGEITLHADHLYVQVSQSAIGADTGILFRSCEGRRDYTGGRNNFASLDLLHRPAELARLIRRHSLPRTPDQLRGKL